MADAAVLKEPAADDTGFPVRIGSNNGARGRTIYHRVACHVA